MRDTLNSFGTISLSGTAQVVSSDVLDFGPIDERASMQTHRTGEHTLRPAPLIRQYHRRIGITVYHAMIPRLDTANIANRNWPDWDHIPAYYPLAP